MQRGVRLEFSVALMLFSMQPLQAQTVTPPYGPDVNAEQAQLAMTVAENKAREMGLKVSITIVESSGDLVMFKKMTGAGYGSVAVSTAKAKAAATGRRPTKAMADVLAAGSILPLALPGVMPVEGGVPILVEGKSIGGIGVSGGKQEEDGRIAQAGADAVAKVR